MLDVLNEKREVPNREAQVTREARLKTPMAWRLRAWAALFAALSLVLGGAVWNMLSARGTARASSLAAARTPITVIDEVEYLPAPAWKAIPLSLPYDGTVRIDVRVVRGHLIDLWLVTSDQLERIERKEWSSLKPSGGVKAIKTKSYQCAARLTKGNYYLVVSDMSVGVPSAEPTEVTSQVRLDP